MLSFDWDQQKAHSNLARHGVSFSEAVSVFKLRILLVVHCERNNGRTIRIISARKATTKERSHYRGPKP